MSFIFRNYYDEVALGNITGKTVFNKFGKNPDVGTTVETIATTGVYQTPTELTSLEVLSSSANDTAAGTGARKVIFVGLSTAFAETTEEVTLNGTSAVALANQYFRIYRWYVSESGTYATSIGGSHAGTLTLRAAGGGTTWDTIGLIDGILGRGQSQISAYTVPAGKKLLVYSFDFSISSTKVINLYLFQRTIADDVTSPYTAMRVVREYDGLSGLGGFPLVYPLVFSEKTDVGFMAEVTTGTAAVSVQFDGVLVTL